MQLPRTLRFLALGAKLGTLVRDPLVTPDDAIGSDQLPSDTPCTSCNGAGDSPPRTPKAGVGRSNRLGGHNESPGHKAWASSYSAMGYAAGALLPSICPH